jgi:hypothetical protein
MSPLGQPAYRPIVAARLSREHVAPLKSRVSELTFLTWRQPGMLSLILLDAESQIEYILTSEPPGRFHQL